MVVARQSDNLGSVNSAIEDLASLIVSPDQSPVTLVESQLLQAAERLDPASLGEWNPPMHFGSLVETVACRWLSATSAQHEQGQEIVRRLNASVTRLRALESLSRCPIVAVTGMLNAGKSTLISTYLHASNHRRVLCGTGNTQGTHRFVLWLPSIWRDNRQLRQTLVATFERLGGQSPELLSSDVEQAVRQYNGEVFSELRIESGLDADTRDPTAIPLIAYDDALNDLKLGLLDCPDIQTGFMAGHPQAAQGASLAKSRRHWLSVFGQLCSAFIVVSKLSELHNAELLKVLGTLRDIMPGVPRFLAVNQVKARYAPEVVAEETQCLRDRFHMQSVYMAYNFRSFRAAERVPPPPTGMATDREQPIFFRLNAPGSSPTATAKATTVYLYHLGQRLDAGALSRSTNQAVAQQLTSTTSQAVDWLLEAQRQHQDCLQAARRSVAEACLEFMSEDDYSSAGENNRAFNANSHNGWEPSASDTISEGSDRRGAPSRSRLRLRLSPRLVGQLADSLQRTAPGWLRFSLGIDRRVRQLHQAVADSASRLKLLGSASESINRLTKRFRSGDGGQTVTPEILCRQIRRFDWDGNFERVPDAVVVEASCQALTLFEQEDATDLGDEQLDELSREIWANMPLSQKVKRGSLPLAMLFAPLLAVVLVPIDAGGSAVVVFASIKELLAAAGLSTLMITSQGGRETLAVLQAEMPWRQMSDLFALTSDAFGMPRLEPEQLPELMLGGQRRRLMPSRIDRLGNPVTLTLASWKIDENWLERIERKLKCSQDWLEQLQATSEKAASVEGDP